MNAPDVRAAWAARAGEFSPRYYAHHGPDHRSESVRELLVEAVGRDAAVLELGCSAGRHLEHLREDGFSDLAGIDVNEAAFDVLAEEYPDLADAASLYQGSFETVLPEFADDAFDAVFSVETIQHVHPDETVVFDEIARVARDCIVTVENEGAVEPDEEAEDDVNFVSEDVPLYYRDWESVFSSRGFEQVEARAGKRTTTRRFRSDE